MYTLIIGKSKSVNFKNAVKKAVFLGGTYDGNNITITVNEEMKAYEILFPLFRLNVLNWKNTRAYHNGHKVDPYRFMFLMDRKRKVFYGDILEQLDDIKFVIGYGEPIPFLYYKREENRFFFQGETKSFDIVFEGKRLYEFVDDYSLGDLVYFE